jgi:hypothetical protein
VNRTAATGIVADNMFAVDIATNDRRAIDGTAHSANVPVD